MPDTTYQIGKTKIIDDGTTTEVSVNGTVRLTINHASGAVTIGQVDGTGDNTLRASEVVATNINLTGIVHLTSTSGISPASNRITAYQKGSKLIFAYKSGINSYYYYADLSSGADITHLTYSATEP